VFPLSLFSAEGFGEAFKELGGGKLDLFGGINFKEIGVILVALFILFLIIWKIWKMGKRNTTRMATSREW